MSRLDLLGRPDFSMRSVIVLMEADEIKVGMWSLKAFKALGLNGLHAGFFQCFWLIVGNSVVEEVKKIFAAKEIPEELNRTFITLNPKIPGPETLNNYRPINLCNTVYKIVLRSWLPG